MLISLALLIFWAIAEVLVAIQVAHAIGALDTILLLIVSCPIGIWAMRSQGRVVWRRLTGALAVGRPPGREVLDGALVLIGGLLLIVPGFIGDLAGALLLVAPSRGRTAPGSCPQLTRPAADAGRPVHAPGAGVRRRCDRHRPRAPAARAMNARGSTSFATLAFGELDVSLWGAAWIHGPATSTSSSPVTPTGQERFVATGRR